MITDYEIVDRFFACLALLKERRVIRGVQTFTRRYDIDRRNLAKLREDFSRGIFKPCWLSFLVKDYGVDARWLLTGEGSPL